MPHPWRPALRGWRRGPDQALRQAARDGSPGYLVPAALWLIWDRWRRTRRIDGVLTWPLGILVVLFQSAFWVPTYASQAQGNPGRLVTYVRASIGDAKQLNPVVSKFFRVALTAGQMVSAEILARQGRQSGRAQCAACGQS